MPSPVSVAARAEGEPNAQANPPAPNQEAE